VADAGGRLTSCGSGAPIPPGHLTERRRRRGEEGRQAVPVALRQHQLDQLPHRRDWLKVDLDELSTVAGDVDSEEAFPDDGLLALSWELREVN
jgi:hypothetical protein